VAYEATLGEFHGPLDVLFALAESGELDPGSLCLAEAVRQYLDYLQETAQESPGQLAEVLLLLAKLVALKAHRLASPQDTAPPSGPVLEEPAGDLLARRLEEYNLYYQARLALAERAESGLHSFIRLAPPPEVGQRLAPSSVSLELLVVALKRVLATAPSPAKASNGPTLGERIAALRQAMTVGVVRLGELFAQAASRVEIIVTFLALLELIRIGEARVRQEGLFGEILVEPRPEPQERDRAEDVDAHVDGAGEATRGDDLV
jgi:segregation and condensation protein A